MKKYSAIVKLDGQTKFIENQEYETMKSFISDLRANGFTVNSSKVKLTEVFDYIMNEINCDKLDWLYINTAADVELSKAGLLTDKAFKAMDKIAAKHNL